jgi:hypothetical protein
MGAAAGHWLFIFAARPFVRYNSVWPLFCVCLEGGRGLVIFLGERTKGRRARHNACLKKGGRALHLVRRHFV